MYEIIIDLWLKKTIAIIALKQVFNKYTRILHRSSIPASILIPGLLSCFCLEHETISGIQKQANKKNKQYKTKEQNPHTLEKKDMRFRLKIQNEFCFGHMTSPTFHYSISPY